jgi:hypothetical protein
MEKTYKIRPLEWNTETIPTDQYGEGWKEHSALGANYYYIREDSEGIEYIIFDDAGDFIRKSGEVPTFEEAKKICEDHYFERMTDNLIEL